jgi:hypothetical protein
LLVLFFRNLYSFYFASAFGYTPGPYYNPTNNIALIVLERLHPKDDHVHCENETEEKPAHYCAPKPKPTATTTMKNR